MGIGLRVMWYLRIQTLLVWCFGCKSRKTYQIRLWMAKFDFRFSQWKFKCAHMTVGLVDWSHISNITSKMGFFYRYSPSFHENLLCAQLGNRAAALRWSLCLIIDAAESVKAARWEQVWWHNNKCTEDSHPDGLVLRVGFPNIRLYSCTIRNNVFFVNIYTDGVIIGWKFAPKLMTSSCVGYCTRICR